MAEASGRDCDGEAPPPVTSSVAEGGEKFLRIFCQEKCVLIVIILDSAHLPI